VRAIAEGAGRYGRFDILFSNAGISGAVAAIGEYPSEEFARTLAVHVLGAFHVLKHGAPHVPDGGSIIITSSVAGLMGFEGWATPGILEAMKPGRMQGHGGTAEVPG